MPSALLGQYLPRRFWRLYLGDFDTLIFSRSYLSNGQAIGTVVVRLSVHPSVCHL